MEQLNHAMAFKTPTKLPSAINPLECSICMNPIVQDDFCELGCKHRIHICCIQHSSLTICECPQCAECISDSLIALMVNIIGHYDSETLNDVSSKEPEEPITMVHKAKYDHLNQINAHRELLTSHGRC